ncbi:MAG: NADH-quinone oxidoreductase subunit H [Candidatus Heimdallarchaeota archaeon LC_3]|nr:MAG: NADH-quinone oxidoreductase subunit H [Candidatus Heimdallarchaeota archaeon LC_3]
MASLTESLADVLYDILYAIIPLSSVVPETDFIGFAQIGVFSIIVLLFLTVDVAIIIVWMERKLIARMMVRRGPTHIGPYGLMQNIADAIKLISKELLIPIKADKFGFLFSLFLMIATAAISMMVIPWSNNFVITDPQAGMLFIFAVFSIYPIAVLVAGWASNNKYSLLGGFRSAAQLISYEIPMVLSVVGVILLINWDSEAGIASFSFQKIVDYQLTHGWLVFPLFLGFVVYFVAMLGETERIPFDLPEAESELVMGWRTEYAAGPYMLIMAIEYFHVFVNASIGVLIFFGGWERIIIPGVLEIPLEIGGFPIYALFDPALWFLFKLHVIIIFMILIRAALPRVRVDQFLTIGWTRLIPLAFLNLIIAVVIGAVTKGF